MCKYLFMGVACLRSDDINIMTSFSSDFWYHEVLVILFSFVYNWTLQTRDTWYQYTAVCSVQWFRCSVNTERHSVSTISCNVCCTTYWEWTRGILDLIILCTEKNGRMTRQEARKQDSELGLRTQNNTRGQPVKNLRSYLEEIVAAPGLENRSYDRRDSLRWPRDTLYPLKFGGIRCAGHVTPSIR
jgi:hypothetical protein